MSDAGLPPSAAAPPNEMLAIHIVEALRPLVPSCDWDEPHGREAVTVKVVADVLRAASREGGSSPDEMTNERKLELAAEIARIWAGATGYEHYASFVSPGYQCVNLVLAASRERAAAQPPTDRLTQLIAEMREKQTELARAWEKFLGA